MKQKLATLVLMSALGFTGCSQPVEEGPEPITIRKWQELPLDQKYTAEAIERLKEGNSQLQTPEGWEAFSRTTLVATRRKDFARLRR